MADARDFLDAELRNRWVKAAKESGRDISGRTAEISFRITRYCVRVHRLRITYKATHPLRGRP